MNRKKITIVMILLLIGTTVLPFTTSSKTAHIKADGLHHKINRCFFKISASC